MSEYYVELAKVVIAPLVDDLSAVDFHYDNYMLNVDIPESEFGRIIGKGGDLANAIREVIAIKAKLEAKKVVKVQINVKK
jgi:predicted RNA-binding protein YlqC (UPF0109 family)